MVGFNVSLASLLILPVKPGALLIARIMADEQFIIDERRAQVLSVFDRPADAEIISRIFRREPD